MRFINKCCGGEGRPRETKMPDGDTHVAYPAY
ncbi:hypothetical protein SeGA_0635, partial [Salmonella enterica subsp. enterica serovar Gaminara str. A4-567]